MRWALNSDFAVSATDLRSHLEATVAHYKKTRERQFAKNLLAYEEPTKWGPIDDDIDRQMRAGIEAACLLASAMNPDGTLFFATLSGHVDADDPNGITERMAVFVDTAPKPRVS